MPVVSRTRATFRNAEFGFLGVEVYTRVHTPLFCGAPFRAGVLVFFLIRLLPILDQLVDRRHAILISLDFRSAKLLFQMY
jgi:hypothetical protein